MPQCEAGVTIVVASWGVTATAFEPDETPGEHAATAEGTAAAAGCDVASAFWPTAFVESRAAAAGCGTAFTFWAIETLLCGSAVTAEGEKATALGQKGDAASQKVESNRHQGAAAMNTNWILRQTGAITRRVGDATSGSGRMPWSSGRKEEKKEKMPGIVHAVACSPAGSVFTASTTASAKDGESRIMISLPALPGACAANLWPHA